MNPNIVEITYDNAQQYLIDESHNRPVVIDFWADWCAPCKALMPILEKLANESAGDFLLAKLNADQLQDIAAQFGVRSLPTVVLMKNGQPVDAFQGGQPESAVRRFLEPHLPRPWDRKLSQAFQLMQDMNYEAAIVLLREAYRESKQEGTIALALAQACLYLNYLEEAKGVLDAVHLKDRDGHYEQLVAQLELKQESAKSPEIQELERRLNEDPDNLEIAFELGVQFSQDNHYREALELLHTVLKADRNFRDGGARKIYLDILATLGKGNPLAIEFQKKIFSLLY